MSQKINRRVALETLATGGVGLTLLSSLASASAVQSGRVFAGQHQPTSIIPLNSSSLLPPDRRSFSTGICGTAARATNQHNHAAYCN